MAERWTYYVTMEVRFEAEDTLMGDSEAIATVTAQNVANMVTEMFGFPCIVGDVDKGELVLPKRRN